MVFDVVMLILAFRDGIRAQRRAWPVIPNERVGARVIDGTACRRVRLLADRLSWGNGLTALQNGGHDGSDRRSKAA